jgi:large subunit ribosomal protein L18
MKKEEQIKKIRKARRGARIRKAIKADSSRARLTVFRSNKYIYAQIIDDKKGVTLAAANEKEIETKGNRIEAAKLVGLKLSEKAKSAKVKEVVFDKGSYKYHGRVKALADGAREGGLVF